jgi:carbon monoxide dehydrogenase subunit G
VDLTGEQILSLPRESVWQALNDPAVLSRCVPGCESFERIADNVFKVVMTASVGPVKARFTGKMTLSDLDPPSGYALSFDGSGGAAGFGKGNARVELAPDGAATRLRYTVKAQVGGRLAQVGSRLIDGVARKMADEFFERFQKLVAPAPSPADAVPFEPEKPRKRAAAIVWVFTAAAVMLAAFLLFRLY